MSKQQYIFFPNYLKVSDHYNCIFNIGQVLILFCMKKFRLVDA